MNQRSKYKHALIFLYVPIYLIAFFLLEQRTGVSYHIIHSPIDDWIPFEEVFVIPYLIWFPYLLGGFAYLFYKSFSPKGKQKFLIMAWQLIAGMSFCLLTYFIWPNGLNLRPEVYPRDNLLTDLCALLQGVDTPTNVCPSIHVYSTLVIHRAVCHSGLGKKRWIVITSCVIAILICLSTMFIKQHSIGDVIAAIILFVVSCLIFKYKK